jgi:hypothetical protein
MTDRWTHAPGDLSTAARLAIIPVHPCVMRAETGDFFCSRKIGCLRCNLAGFPCTKVKT